MKHVIQIHMTNVCNLKCEYCYINQNSKKLTFDVLKNAKENEKNKAKIRKICTFFIKTSYFSKYYIFIILHFSTI